MHALLQINALTTQGADQYIGADTAIRRHIAAGIVEPDITAVVAARDTDLGARIGHQLLRRQRGNSATCRCAF